MTCLRQVGGIADALEVSAPWSRLYAVYSDMREAIVNACSASADNVVVQGHLSHAYLDGGNLYLIFSAEGHEEDVAPLYQRIVTAALTACVRSGGSLSHHHGIGSVRAGLVSLEIGDTGLRTLRSIRRALDPQMLFNPQKLTEVPPANFHD
jgi:alkyldihydroxyacetonephosphate synthase